MVILMTSAAATVLCADILIRAFGGALNPNVFPIAVSLPLEKGRRFHLGLTYSVEFKPEYVRSGEFMLRTTRILPAGGAVPAYYRKSFLGCSSYGVAFRLLSGRVGYEKGVACPLWYLGVLLATYPAIVFLRRPILRERRRRLGLCMACGYSLRGLREPRCPECGTPFARSVPRESDDRDAPIEDR